jgi:hypothetical protein
LTARAERFNLLHKIGLQRAVPLVDFPAGSFSRVPVTLLQRALELIAAAGDCGQIVIGEFTPPFL